MNKFKQLSFTLLCSGVFLTACSSHNLPPAPGEKGDAVLTGIDSNQNGLRDDVEIAIYEHFPKHNDKHQQRRDALKQTAHAIQNAVKAGNQNEKKLAYQAQDEFNRAVKCLNEVMGMGPSIGQLGWIELTVVNTPNRGHAYVAYNELLEGRTEPSQVFETACQTSQ